MSRIGKQAIKIPSGVTVSVNNSTVTCEGALGKHGLNIPQSISLLVDKDQIYVKRSSDSAQTKALHGLWRSLIANAVEGVSRGFEKSLELKGVGYRAAAEGQVLTLWLGYSHPIVYQLPAGASAQVEKNTHIKIHGVDKQLIGEVAATIRRFRPVEPYKGRGIRYRGEVVMKKAGKSAKTSSS